MRRAFTLIELVVVAAVIGLLIGILMPQLAGAMRAAQRVECLANLRQLGQAMLTYMDQENRGILPVCPGYNARRNNANYVEAFELLLDRGYLDAPRPRPDPQGQMITSPPFKCARDHELAPLFGYSYEYSAGGLMSYAWSDEPLPEWAVRATRFYEQWPTDMPLFQDARGFHPESPYYNLLNNSDRNAVYFDGHADWKNNGPAIWRPRPVEDRDIIPNDR